MSSVSDKRMVIGKSYAVFGKGVEIPFTKTELGLEDHRNMNTYKSAGEILAQHRFEHSRIRICGSNRPIFFRITSGPDRGKLLSDIPTPVSSA